MFWVDFNIVKANNESVFKVNEIKTEHKFEMMFFPQPKKFIDS